MLVKEFGNKVNIDCDLTQVSLEEALSLIPNSSDYLLLVHIDLAVDAVVIKRVFEENMKEAHSPRSIHVITFEDHNKKGIFEWQLFSLLGSVWSPGS